MAFRKIDAAVLADLFSRAADLRAGRAEGSEAPRPERSRALIEELFARARQLRDASDEGRALELTDEPGQDSAVGVDGAATDPPTELSSRTPPQRPPRLDHGKAVEEFRRTLEALFEGSGEGDLEALASASGVLEAVTTPLPEPAASAPPPVSGAPLPVSGAPLPRRPGPLPTRERVFSAAAEAIFGDRLDELERLVMATFEARPPATIAPLPASPGVVVGDRPALETAAGGGDARSTFGSLRSPSRSIAARAAAATSTPTPELHAVEPGDPLLQPAKSPSSWLAEPPPPAEQPPRWMSQSSVDGLLGGFELAGGSPPRPEPAPAPAAVDPRITESAVDGVLAGFHFAGGDPIPAALAGPRLPTPVKTQAAPVKAQEPTLDDPYAARAVEAASKSPPSSSGSWGGDSGTGSTVGFDPLRTYAKGTPPPAPTPAPSVASALDMGASFEGFGWPAGATPAPAPSPAPPARTAVPTRLVIPVPSDVDDAPEPVLRPTRPMGRPVPGAGASATIGFDGVLPAGPARGSPTIGFDGVLPAAGPAYGSPTIGFDGVLPAGGPAYGSPTIGFDGVLPAQAAPGPGATIGFDGVLPAGGPARAPGNASTTIGFEGVLPAPAPVRPGGPSSGHHRRPAFAQTVAFDDVLPPPVVAPPAPARSNAPWLLASGNVRAPAPPPPREDPGLHSASPSLHSASPSLHSASPSLHSASPSLHSASPSSTLGFDGVIGAPPRAPEARPGRPEVLTTNAAQSARGPRGAGPGPLADFLRALPPGADPLAPAAAPPAGRRPTPTAGLPVVRPQAPDPFANDPFAAPGGPARPGAPAVIGGPGAAWPTAGAGAWPQQQPPTAAWPPPGDPFAPRPAQHGAFVDPFRRDPAASDRPTVYPEEPTAWGQASGGRPPAAGPVLPPPARTSGGSGGWTALPAGLTQPPGRSGGSGAYPTLGQQAQQQPQQPPPGQRPPGRSGGSGPWPALGQQQPPPQQPPSGQRPPGRSGGSGAYPALGQQAQQQPPRQPPPAQPPKAAPRPRPLPPGGKAPGAPGLRASGEGFDPTAPSWWDGEEPPPP